MNAKDRFRSLAPQFGWTVISLNNQHGFGENWDFEIRNETAHVVRVDVKSRKKITREDPSVQDEWTWIELHGVEKNEEGWLFDRNTSWIAFEQKESFFLIDRLKLIDFVQAKVDLTKVVRIPSEAKYAIYSRNGRFDALSLVETRALQAVAEENWTME